MRVVSLIVFVYPLIAHASSLDIYYDANLVAKIPDASYSRISTQPFISGGHKCQGILLADLLRMLHLPVESVILEGGGSSQTLSNTKIKTEGLFLCLSDAHTLRLAGGGVGFFPAAIEKITIKEKSYFTARFLLLIFILCVLLFFLFRYQESILIRSLAVFVACYLIYRPFDLPNIGSLSDNLWSVPTSLSLLKEGNFELSEWREISNLDRKNYRLVKVRGHPYSSYPLGTPLVSLPLVFAGSLLYPESVPQRERVLSIAAMTAKVFAALSVALLFALAFRLTGSTRVSLLLAFLFAFGTNQFNTHAGGLWSHNTGSLLLLVGFLFLTSEKDRIVSLSAIPLGLAYITRPTYAIVIVVVTIYVFVCRRRSLLPYLVYGSLMATGFFALNYAVYGRFFTQYSLQRPHLTNAAEALAGNLISPNRGLFIFAPVFLWSVCGAYLSWVRRDAVLPGFYRMLSFIVIAHWILISLQPPNWSSGYYIGPRKFCDVLPAWVLLWIPTLQRFRVPSFRANWLLVFLATLTVGWSLFVQFRSVTDRGVYQWNSVPIPLGNRPQRVWDWSDLQILRKLALGQPLDVYCGNSLSARIPEGIFALLASQKAPEGKGTVLPVQELSAFCGSHGQEFLFRGSGHAFSLTGDQVKVCFVYFSKRRHSGLKAPMLISSFESVPKMPDGLTQILIR